MSFFINDKKVEWGTMSLKEFLEDYELENWQDCFETEIIETISGRLDNKKNILPPLPYTFTVFEFLKPEDIKIVILGQDPYIKEKQAVGMSFSVDNSVATPPSLKNIFKEIGIDRKPDLTDWVESGVFLYNVDLTVEEGKSGSHRGIWSSFTDKVIQKINLQENIVWILLGNNAKKYKKYINENHHVLEAAHPSPLSARLFFGCNIFKKAENILGYKIFN